MSNTDMLELDEKARVSVEGVSSIEIDSFPSFDGKHELDFRLHHDIIPCISYYIMLSLAVSIVGIRIFPAGVILRGCLKVSVNGSGFIVAAGYWGADAA